MYISEIRNSYMIKCLRDAEFDSVALLGLRRNEKEKHIAYILSENYLEQAINENVECLIVPEEISDYVFNNYDGGICVSNDPKTTFFKVHEFLAKQLPKTPTTIDPTARIADTATIADYNVVIGSNVEIQDNVVIKEDVIIGDNSVVMDGSVIGTPAFYYYGDNETKEMVYSSGKVRLGKNVIIHSNSTICKGVIGGDTFVDDYTSLDNNIFLGHDVQIGKNVIVAAASSFGGWAEMGDNCFLGVGCNIAPMVKIGANVKGSIGAVITKDVPDNTQVSGNFAIEHSKFINHIKQLV